MAARSINTGARKPGLGQLTSGLKRRLRREAPERFVGSAMPAGGAPSP